MRRAEAVICDERSKRCLCLDKAALATKRRSGKASSLIRYSQSAFHEIASNNCWFFCARYFGSFETLTYEEKKAFHYSFDLFAVKTSKFVAFLTIGKIANRIR